MLTPVHKHRDTYMLIMRIMGPIPLLCILSMYPDNIAAPPMIFAVLSYAIGSAVLNPSASKLPFFIDLIATCVNLVLVSITLGPRIGGMADNPAACPSICAGLCWQAAHGLEWAASWTRVQQSIAKPLATALAVQRGIVQGPVALDCEGSCVLSTIFLHLLIVMTVTVILYNRELRLRLHYLRTHQQGPQRSFGVVWSWSVGMVVNLSVWLWLYLAGVHFYILHPGA